VTSTGGNPGFGLEKLTVRAILTLVGLNEYRGVGVEVHLDPGIRHRFERVMHGHGQADRFARGEVGGKPPESKLSFTRDRRSLSAEWVQAERAHHGHSRNRSAGELGGLAVVREL